MEQCSLRSISDLELELGILDHGVVYRTQKKSVMKKKKKRKEKAREATKKRKKGESLE